MCLKLHLKRRLGFLAYSTYTRRDFSLSASPPSWRTPPQLPSQPLRTNTTQRHQDPSLYRSGLAAPSASSACWIDSSGIPYAPGSRGIVEHGSDMFIGLCCLRPGAWQTSCHVCAGVAVSPCFAWPAGTSLTGSLSGPLPAVPTSSMLMPQSTCLSYLYLHIFVSKQAM